MSCEILLFLFLLKDLSGDCECLMFNNRKWETLHSTFRDCERAIIAHGECNLLTEREQEALAVCFCTMFSPLHNL